MFESAVLEVAGGRRARSAVVLPVALLTHALVIGSVVAVQLLAVDELRPAISWVTPVVLPPAPPPAAGPQPRPQGAPVPAARPRQLVQPDTVPETVPAPPDRAEPAAAQGVPFGVGDAADGTGESGSGDGTAVPRPEQVGPPEAPTVLTVGGEVLAPEIVARMMPVYPPAARQAGRQGPVRVRAVIDVEGNVITAEVVDDRPGFGCGEAAVTAIRRWRFRPATLRGRPVAVLMEITVAFTLSRG